MSTPSEDLSSETSHISKATVIFLFHGSGGHPLCPAPKQPFRFVLWLPRGHLLNEWGPDGPALLSQKEKSHMPKWSEDAGSFSCTMSISWQHWGLLSLLPEWGRMLEGYRERRKPTLEPGSSRVWHSAMAYRSHCVQGSHLPPPALFYSIRRRNKLPPIYFPQLWYFLYW